MKHINLLNKLSLSVLMFFLGLSNNYSFAQEYSLGAIPPTQEEYEKFPKADWVVIQRSASENSIAYRNFNAGIVMLNNPEIMDQGSQGSCVGWSVGYAAVSILAYPKYNNNWSIAKRSPSYIFNQIQTGNCDASYLIEGLNLVKNQGICSYAIMPYNVTDCDTQPTNAQRVDAISNNVNWGTLTRNDVSGIKQSIDLGCPVVINFAVTETFDNMWSTNGIWNSTNSSDTIRGFHAACIIGYDDERQMFKVQNSWGKARGDNGFFWITYNLVQNNS